MDEERAQAGKVRDEPQTVSFGPFRFDRRGLLLSKDGTDLPIQPKPLTVLRCLIDRPGEVLLKDELMDLAWDDAAVTENSLAEAIRMLRQALGDDPRSPEYIETVHRRGYRFIAAVIASNEPLDEVPQSDADDAADGFRRPPPSTSRRHAAAASALIVVILSVGAFGVWSFIGGSPAQGEGVSRLTLMLPDAPIQLIGNFVSLSISPDGRTMVYKDSTGDLYVRDLESDAPQRIEGTHGARGAAISPDGREVAFFLNRSGPNGGRITFGLMRAPVKGGRPVQLVTVLGYPVGLGWGPDGTIRLRPSRVCGFCQTSLARRPC